MIEIAIFDKVIVMNLNANNNFSLFDGPRTYKNNQFESMLGYIVKDVIVQLVYHKIQKQIAKIEAFETKQ